MRGVVRGMGRVEGSEGKGWRDKKGYNNSNTCLIPFVTVVILGVTGRLFIMLLNYPLDAKNGYHPLATWDLGAGQQAC